MLPEYVTVFIVGAGNRASKVCPTDAALSRPDELATATITTLTFSVSTIVTVAVVPDTDVVTPVVRTLLSDAFLTCTAVTPEATPYVMVAVFSEYVTELNVGAANVPTNVCPTDAALSRPDELARATTTIFTASVNGTVMVAVNELMELVTPDTTELSDAFRTCTAVTPVATVYVMLAVFPEYVMLPDSVGAANCFSKVCVTDASLTRPDKLATANTTIFNGDIASVNDTAMVAVVPDTELVNTSGLKS
jgi:hypothetical protein